MYDYCTRLHINDTSYDKTMIEHITPHKYVSLNQGYHHTDRNSILDFSELHIVVLYSGLTPGHHKLNKYIRHMWVVKQAFFHFVHALFNIEKALPRHASHSLMRPGA